jgi:hypothetical protein
MRFLAGLCVVLSVLCLFASAFGPALAFFLIAAICAAGA